MRSELICFFAGFLGRRLHIDGYVKINSANELVLTELILENTFANYDPEEVVALLSCFVFQEKTDIEPTVPPKLEQGRDAILKQSTTAWVECKILQSGG